MNERTIAKKQQEVDQIVEQMKSSDAMVAVDYLGLTVEEDTALRQQLRQEGVTYKVVKNTIMRRAMSQMGIEDYHESVFQGPTAVAFSGEDALAPARILKNFSKDHKKLELKGGVLEGRTLTLEELTRIASLPGREGLYSMLLSVLQAPIRNVAYAVKAVHDKQEAEE